MTFIGLRTIFSENRYPSPIGVEDKLFGIVRVEGVMTSSLSRLPSRFPIGTKFVIEGRPGGEGQMQIFSRYLEFPDGTFLPLPARPAKRKAAPRRRPRRARSH